ncbi:MAG: DNA-3-methyladenine glycosylase 2 family protein [Candidatus Limnocylindrales bacterium]
MNHAFELRPVGPFSLAAAEGFGAGFGAGIGAHESGPGVVMAFPIEGWTASAAVEIRQDAGKIIHGSVAGPTDPDDLAMAQRQALRCLSLDHDGAGWAVIGERDPVIGRLQAQYDHLRPVCFYSAYEAATSFVIGQRISMRQTRAVKRSLADEHGDAIELNGRRLHAFPRPQRLRQIESVQGISEVKVQRLRALAEAALDGRLDTETLRSMPEANALAALRELPGIGEWTAQAVLFRGCGVADAIPATDEISRNAVQWAYELREPPDDASWARISDGWRPYRMWASVLLHLAWRRDQPTGPSYRQG